jgi:hypothetical protein
VAYIGYYSRKIAPEELVDFQKSHYGGVIFPASQIAHIEAAILSHLRTRRSRPLPLFAVGQWQRDEISARGVQKLSPRQEKMVGWKNLADDTEPTSLASPTAGPATS